MSAAAHVTVPRSGTRTSEIAWACGLAAALTASFSRGNSFSETSEMDLELFPDWMTVLVIPVFVCLALWMRERSGPPETAAALRHYGWNIVKWAALLFGVCAAALSGLRASPPAPFLLIVFAMSCAITAILGFIAADLGSRTLVRRRVR
jgi:hypothetical protein